MDKIVVFDNKKTVKEESLRQILLYCGQVKSLSKVEKPSQNCFIAEFENESSAANAVFLSNTLIDGSQITVIKYSDYDSSNVETPEIQINSTPQIVENDDVQLISDTVEKDEKDEKIENSEKVELSKNEKIEHAKEQIVKSAKTISVFAETSLFKLEAFMIDAICEGRDTVDKMRGVEKYKEYEVHGDLKHSDGFKAQKFTVQQTQQTQLVPPIQIQQNELPKKTQKPLPPIPPKKREDAPIIL
ncbi:hypothetical protein EIN_162030 [Entamoeba invadens IP1]|uniref:RRM domain-containing protein n=1 Tax=Entamoeba invadens IP1 TaxID=370355 RepID=A0A0A1TYK6_ENTIV|nr:hypothetical protein EIN_162030 [Entamoeba invadens IP1]ELP86569.1 hypothetical protein EIN_162030 [Entamoeba invadens IP1]|eukprot:XP_004185915.1 hypothetical protein EIN_162030 [Entamoeba invadens IP1]